MPQAKAHHPEMRLIPLVILLLALTACAGDPRDYGITGARAPAPPVAREDGGMPGTFYGPSVTPSPGSGKFFGYN